jgi:flagellar L-ring protein precursor FlgH
MKILTKTVLAATLCFTAQTTIAQQSTLYQRDQTGGIPLASSSLIYSEANHRALLPKVHQLNDLVTIRVNEASNFTSEGEIDRRNVSSVDARLQNWIALDGLNLNTAEKTGTELPRARGNYNQQTRANGDLYTRELLVFNVTARVVDIRPNGNLVLEARKTMRVDDEIVENMLTGTVRREDILPNNTVLSEKLAELEINRRTVGHVRDSYKRGWLAKFWDGVNPF